MAFWRGNRPGSALLPIEPITRAHASIVKATDPVALHLALPVVTWRPRRDQLADCYHVAAVALLANVHGSSTLRSTTAACRYAAGSSSWIYWECFEDEAFGHRPAIIFCQVRR